MRHCCRILPGTRHRFPGGTRQRRLPGRGGQTVGGKGRGGHGSGPNLHEGVTTLIAELMDKGIVDGVTTIPQW
jgi:hypothetical protein